MSETVGPVTIARMLATKAGLPAPRDCERLEGGRNNQVFRVRFNGAPDLVLKLYHYDERDPRDRLGAEWDFLTYVWQRGVRNVPAPVVKDDFSHAAFLGFIENRKKTGKSELNENDIHQAADFVAAINAAPRKILSLNPGSEACFCLADHVATVDRRLERLNNLDREAPLVDEALQLVSTQVIPSWKAIRSEVLRKAEHAKLDLDEVLEEPDMCVSPSDFGFHNALTGGDNRIAFIDFEYAGRDDPSKLICDFLCQPEVPVPEHLASLTFDVLSEALSLSESYRQRTSMLLNTYRIKWICIMLNEFLPIGRARRAFASISARQDRCEEQIAKIRTSLTHFSTH